MLPAAVTVISLFVILAVVLFGVFTRISTIERQLAALAHRIDSTPLSRRI